MLFTTFKRKKAEYCEYVVPRIRIRGGNHWYRYSLYSRYFYKHKHKPKRIHRAL